MTVSELIKALQCLPPYTKVQVVVEGRFVDTHGVMFSSTVPGVGLKQQVFLTLEEGDK